MIRIINNTDQHIDRLLILYAKELGYVKGQNVECIVFDMERMTVFGIDCILLECS